jgi:hypothetical protein
VCIKPTKKNIVAFLRKVAWYSWITIYSFTNQKE